MAPMALYGVPLRDVRNALRAAGLGAAARQICCRIERVHLDQVQLGVECVLNLATLFLCEDALCHGQFENAVA